MLISRPLLVAGLLTLPLTACDRGTPDPPTSGTTAARAPGASGAPGAPAPTPIVQAPAGHADVWARYLEKNPTAADAGWVVDGGGLGVTQLDAMGVNLKTTFNATGWALARSADGTRFILVTDFATSGDALKMLSFDPTGKRYNTLAVFEPPADAVRGGTAQLADDLLNAALTRLAVIRTQCEAYAAAHDGASRPI